jgi:hypothetical protein
MALLQQAAAPEPCPEALALLMLLPLLPCLQQDALHALLKPACVHPQQALLQQHPEQGVQGNIICHHHSLAEHS